MGEGELVARGRYLCKLDTIQKPSMGSRNFGKIWAGYCSPWTRLLEHPPNSKDGDPDDSAPLLAKRLQYPVPCRFLTWKPSRGFMLRGKGRDNPAEFAVHSRTPKTKLSSNHS